jgi:ubiquinone/menaquinone biosynthesis C-methylase UbiE
VDKEGKLFNTIAPIYGLFFNFQVRYYKKILGRVKEIMDLSLYQNIIDVGCGTGALCLVLSNQGLRVTGLDSARKMLRIAEQNLRNKEVSLLQANILEQIPLPDKSFDLAISSYVAHGLQEQERRIMYAEMSRLAKHLVIIHDYNEQRAWHTDFAEWLEGGDYFHFIKNAKSEMAESFKRVQVIRIDTRAAWYLGTPWEK